MLMRRRISQRAAFRYVCWMLSAILIAVDSPRAPLRREAVARSLDLTYTPLRQLLS